MTIDPTTHVTSKIKRAKQHLADLDGEIRRFLESDPYKVSPKRDPETRRLIYYVSEVRRTPDVLPLIAGDAFQNLMSALDHLAFQLVMIDTNGHPPKPRRIYFPIFDDLAQYEAEKQGKMQGALKQTFDAIDGTKPYKGGNDDLWILHRLNNIEKHRLLITVGSMFRSIDLGADISARMQKAFPNQKIPAMHAFFKPADVMFPLKEGDELFIGAPDDEVNEKMQFRFDVALNEQGIIEGQSLLETANKLTEVVDGIVSKLILCVK